MRIPSVSIWEIETYDKLAWSRNPPPPPHKPPATLAQTPEQRGVQHAMARRWPAACNEFRQVRQANPGNLWLWLFDATAMLSAKDQSAYQALGPDLVARFKTVTDANSERGVAHIASVGSDAVPAELFKGLLRRPSSIACGSLTSPTSP